MGVKAPWRIRASQIGQKFVDQCQSGSTPIALARRKMRAIASRARFNARSFHAATCGIR